MDIKQFADAVIKGATTGGFKSDFGLEGWSDPQLKHSMEANAGGTMYGAIGQAGQSAEEKRKVAEANSKMMADPSKYQRLRKEDGGFAFYDPSGKEIDINQYAQATGARRVDVLKDSENPLDQQYIRDWSVLNDATQAMTSNDIPKINEYIKRYPGAFKGGTTPQAVMEQLIQKYPHMYGKGSYEQSKSNFQNPLFRSIPEENASSEIIAQLQQLAQQGGN